METQGLNLTWANAWAQLKELQRAGWQFTLTPTHTPFGVISSVVVWTFIPNPFFAEYRAEWKTQTGVPITTLIALIDADALPKAIADMHALIFPISPIGNIPAREL